MLYNVTKYYLITITLLFIGVCIRSDKRVKFFAQNLAIFGSFRYVKINYQKITIIQ